MLTAHNRILIPFPGPTSHLYDKLPMDHFVDETPVGQMSGRVGTSLLTALGLSELSIHSAKALEDAAVHLVSSKARLSSLRNRCGE